MFKRVKDPLVTDASNGASPTAIDLVVGSSGTGASVYALSPFGIAGVTATAAAGGAVSFSSSNFYSAYLPWLYNQARNFERYRVLSATLVIIGSVGSTATGRVVVTSSTDVVDYNSPPQVGLSTGGVVFDLSTLASKERRIPLRVDSSWKVASSRTVVVANSSSLAIPINTANDLLFTNFSVNVVGGTANGSSGSFTAANYMLEYDVEFKDPIAYGANN